MDSSHLPSKNMREYNPLSRWRWACTMTQTVGECPATWRRTCSVPGCWRGAGTPARSVTLLLLQSFFCKFKISFFQLITVNKTKCLLDAVETPQSLLHCHTCLWQGQKPETLLRPKTVNRRSRDLLVRGTVGAPWSPGSSPAASLSSAWSAGASAVRRWAGCWYAVLAVLCHASERLPRGVRQSGTASWLDTGQYEGQNLSWHLE